VLNATTHRTPTQSPTLLHDTRAARTLMWKMTLNANETRCVINAGPHGFEVQNLLNGSLLSAYRFERVDEVLSWASERLSLLEARGWERA